MDSKASSSYWTSTGPFPEKFYVVYRGRNPGIYVTLEACKQQTRGFKGSSYESVDTLERAQTLLASYLERQDRLEAQKNIKDFYNSGIPETIFKHLNESWKAYIQKDNILYRQSMGRLADAIYGEVKAKEIGLNQQKTINDNMQNIIFKIIKTLEWGENYNHEQVDLFLQLTEEYCPQDKEIWQLRKLCLFYKAQKDLPFEVFQKINGLVNKVSDSG